MTDTGRTLGPTPVRDPISGELKSVEQWRHERDPIAIARKEGWTVSQVLGEPAAEKDGRRIVDIDQTSGFVFSDEVPGLMVLSYSPQVRAALRGTRCTCHEPGADGGSRSTHESSCPLSEVA